jgi:hypothetical protein
MNMPPELTSAGADIGAVTIGCNIVGMMLKAIPYTPDWTIPLALPIVGAVSMGAMSGWNMRSIITGLTAGWAAVGAHQALRQLTNHQQPAKQNE